MSSDFAEMLKTTLNKMQERIDDANQTYEGDRIKSYLSSNAVPSSVRLVVNEGSPQTVYLDDNPEDGQRFAVIDAGGTFGTHAFTVNAGTRKIEGSRSVLLNTDNISGVWFYRADQANWAKVDTLDENSDMPFPFEFDDLFITKLATRLHPRYLVETSQETLMHYRDLLRRFRSRYSVDKPMPSELALRVVHPYRHQSYVDKETETLFNKGLI